MAERRMFAKSIIDSDAFLDMPLSAQCLYFHLAMRADDDGFINNPKKIQRMVGASEDDLKLLIAKRFIIVFDTGVVVIKHWRIHNYIQKDRYHETNYIEEKSRLSIKDNGAYTMDTPCIQDGYSLDTQVRLGKDSKGKDRIVEEKEKRNRFTPPTIEEVSDYVKRKGYNVDPEAFVAFYESKGWKVGSQPMKSWQSAVVTWSKRNSSATKNNFSTQRDDDLDEWAENNQDEFYKKWGD